MFYYKQPPATLTEKQLQRLWSKIDRRGSDECWLWQGSFGFGGYGQIRIDSQCFTVHRVVLTLTRGSSPEATPVACHKCDVRLCCNPSHLFWGTQAQNVKQAYDNGRRPILVGQSMPKTKLTEAQVLALRADAAAGVKTKTLAEKYGICKRQAWVIKTQRQWTHI